MSMGRQDGLDRRSACSVLGLLAGAIAMIGTRVPAQAGSSATTGSVDDFPFGRTDEHDLSASDPSLSPRLRALIRIGEDGIARENKGALADFFHPQYRFHGPGAAELDREGLWDYFVRCRAAFDDFAVTRQAAISDGTSYIACRTRFSGRFVRPFTGMGSSSLEPNGRMVEYQPINIFHYASDGRLIEEWAQYDLAGFLTELQRA